MSKYESAEYQNKVRDFVAREVIYCVSSLVHELAKNEKHLDDLTPVLVQDDWITPAEEAGAKLHYREDDDHWCVLDQKDNDLWNTIFSSKQGAARGYCDQNKIDPYVTEAYEHWIVSGWLADKLEAKGEMIARDFMGLTIWGRACTGQAILLDSVICAIYDELHARETDTKRKAATLDALISVKP